MTEMTHTEKRTLLETEALAEAIQSLKRVPEGHLYAQVMNYMNLETFQNHIQFLCHIKWIKNINHEIIWIK